ncbi:ImmA/IrrE family metallo-endopeptidase [Exiguobacterium sp. s142]|uniref:ImmA/IrrE family metallo-endopeptidase n=1 Tax=Exiguobacterium sp. s142 TaxID=2751222 RepID=UPI001BEA294F|nr:ImmA/IrrE family metallo-endopeptidase [Exiguobacterium sp. s142]
MINQQNLLDVIEQNKRLLPEVVSKVENTKDKGLAFRLKTHEAIKNELMKYAHVLLFPSEEQHYGGLVTYRNGTFYIHINTSQPRVYENFMWAHEYYHYMYEQEEIKNSTTQTFFDDSVLNENERKANLFAGELLINGHVLKESYESIKELYPEDDYRLNIIRLIPIFEVPYKSLVIKMTQDGLISETEGLAAIDYEYRNQLPSDIDRSLFNPTLAIKLNELNRMLQQQRVSPMLRESDLQSFESIYAKHMKRLVELQKDEW